MFAIINYKPAYKKLFRKLRFTFKLQILCSELPLGLARRLKMKPRRRHHYRIIMIRPKLFLLNNEGKIEETRKKAMEIRDTIFYIININNLLPAKTPF